MNHNVTDEDAWALLRDAEEAWRNRDVTALTVAMHPDIRIVFNFGDPVCGIDEATAWIQTRLKTQLGYVLNKRMRGIYGGDTIVSQWMGTWRDAAAQEYHGIGIELLTVDQAGLITRWDAVMHTEQV